jgi:glycosyl transferase family 25
LFGIVTQPPADEVRRRAVILLNAGADYHIGASRLYVSMARRWAQHGYVVLRMDLAGLGDSGTRPGRTDDDVFPSEALDDIRAAIAFLRSGYGVRDVTLAGLCSGAYHSLRGAVAGLPVNRILMVNPQNYFWKPGESLNDLQLAEVVHNPGVYRKRLFSPAAWKKLFTGDVNLVRIVKIYLHRPLLAAESSLRNMARRLRLRLPSDLGTELEEVVARGVRVVFVFAKDEPGIELLKLQAGTSVKRLAERCRIRTINSGDHVFTRSGPRAVMEKVVSDELFSRPEWIDKSEPSLPDHRMTLYDYFDRIAIIHLPDRVDRFQSLSLELLDLGIDIGQSKVTIPHAPVPSEWSGWPSRGVYGNFLSHLGILKQALQDGLRTIWVLEDNAIFSRRMRREQQALVETLQQREWDLCFFGHSLKSELAEQPDGLVPANADFIWAHCYAVHVRVLPRLVAYLERAVALPAHHPEGSGLYIDAAFTLFRRLNPDVVALVYNPALSIQKGCFSSLNDLKWYDALAVTRPLVSLARRARDHWWKLRA